MNAAIRWAVPLSAMALATPLHAQSPMLLAQDCIALADPPRLELHTGPAVPAGSSVLVALAANSNSVSDVHVDDPVASRYFSMGGSRKSANGLALVLLRAPLERPLPAASQVTVVFGNVSPGTYACAQAYAVGGLGFGGRVLDALGAGGGGTTPMLASPSSIGTGPELVFAAFASDAALGDATLPAGTLGRACAADVCVTAAYYVANGGGVAGIAFAGGSQTRWVGALGALYADGIFGNGFN